MNRPLFFIKQAALILVFGCVLALGVITIAPRFADNTKFLLVLPFAATALIVMALNFRWTVIIVVLTRDLLDPILQQTKAKGAGIGGLLNLFVILMVAITVLRFPEKFKKNRFIIPWILFLIVCIPAIYHSPDRAGSIRLWLTLFTYACMFLAPFFVVTDENSKAYWMRLLVIASIFPTLIACGAYAIHYRSMTWDGGRLNGTFAHANILAFYTVFVITLSLYVLKTGILNLSFSKKVGLLVYMGILMVVLLLTQTRSAWVACFLIFLAFGIAKDRKILFYFFIAGLLLSATPVVQNRLRQLREGTGIHRYEKLNSMTWRLTLWQSSVPTMMQKPVLGHGLGAFRFYSKDFFSIGGDHSNVPAHSVFVQLMYETGIVGFLFYLAIFMYMLRFFFRRIRATVGAASVEATIAVIYIVSYLVISYSDNVLDYLAFNWYFWFFCGLLLAGIEKTSETKQILPEAA